jgi:hypothetical protein
MPFHLCVSVFGQKDCNDNGAWYSIIESCVVMALDNGNRPGRKNNRRINLKFHFEFEHLLSLATSAILIDDYSNLAMVIVHSVANLTFLHCFISIMVSD